MGGNTTITTKGGIDISAERIPLKEIGRDNFVKKFQKFLLKINKEFKKENKFPIWEDEKEIMNGGIFNGSTSFIMNPNYDTEEIVKYKPSAGDLDVAVPKEIGKEIFNFLQKHEGREFVPGIKYVGNNANTEDKLGNTIICIANAKFKTPNGEISVQAQLDLELSEMVHGKQTDWSAFAHSSSFEDAKAGMKGVASKYFWRALVGALHQLESGFVVASPSSKIGKITLTKKQPSKIRLLNFGVDSGVGAGYEIMMDGKKPLEIDGNVVYRQKKPAEKSYDKNLVNLMKSVFGVDNIKPKDLHSFVKVLELTNKYTDNSVKQVALDRFLSILFCNEGGQCQVIEPDAKEDVKLKSGIYLKAVELLRLNEDKNLAKIIKAYVEKTHGLKERLRRHLAGNPDEFFDAIREDKEENKEEENQVPTEEPSKKEKDSKKPKDEDDKKLSKEEKEELKRLEIEKKEIAEREKEVIKKLIELSIELDAASSDEEKAKIQKQMDILDKTADKKKEVKKDKEKEVKDKEDKEEKPEKEPKDEEPEEPEEKDKGK